MAPRNRCQACCPPCGLHFAGTSAFDRHLSDEGHRDPREVRRRDGTAGLVVKTEAGECRMIVADRDGRPVPPLAPVTIWQEPIGNLPFLSGNSDLSLSEPEEG
jgi:hypothetical protein